MRFSFSWKRLFLAVLLLLCARIFQATELPARPSIPNLRVLTRNSGYVFSGTVKAVARIAPTGKNSVAVFRITFQIDQGFRGVRTGETLVVREWAGLWQSGERYRPGERVMLFLYPPSRLGLTSPVGGPQGRFQISHGGQIIVEPHRMPTANAPGPWQAPKNILINPRDLAGELRQAEEE